MPFASRGTFAVLSILALALAMASYAWWYNYSHSQRILDLYGPEAATLIRTAPVVEILSGDAGSNLDISQAPGLLHARTSLIADASYDWTGAPAFVAPPVASVRFRRGEQSIVIDFDFANRLVRPSSTGKTGKLIPKTSAGWQAFIERNIRQASASQHHPP
jgi:hypothetical protein